MPGPNERPINDFTDASDDYAAIAERAAALGITPERVLQEWARIAFADLRRIADWGPDGFKPKHAAAIAADDAAAIAEISPTPGGCRVKLHDKRAALSALSRHLGIDQPPRQRQPSTDVSQASEDPRDVIVRRLARLATGAAAGRAAR